MSAASWAAGRPSRRTLSLSTGDGQTPYPTLESLLIGHFDGEKSAAVVSFYDPYGVSSGPLNDRFVIWRGGVRSLFSQLSWQNMR